MEKAAPKEKNSFSNLKPEQRDGATLSSNRQTEARHIVTNQIFVSKYMIFQSCTNDYQRFIYYAY